MSRGFSDRYDQTGCELGVEVCALRWQQNTLTRSAFDSIDIHRVRRVDLSRAACTESFAADLDSRYIPTGGEAMVPIGEEQIFPREGVLQSGDRRRLRNRPDLVDCFK